MRIHHLVMALCGMWVISAQPVAAKTSGLMLVTTDTVLTEDHDGPIEIVADNITLNCRKHLVSGTGWSGVSGIHVANRIGVSVHNCHVSQFDSMGIAIVESANTQIVDNLTEQNAGNGIFVVRSQETSLIKNESRANSAHGIVVHDSFANALDGNRVYANAQTGFQLLRTAGSRFTGNVAERNGSLAWWLIGSSDNQFERNAGDATVGGGGWYISDESSRNVFVKNTSSHNAIDGFTVDTGSNGNSFLQNTASENDSTGFASLTHGNVFTDNIANKNKADGFVIVAGNNTLMSSNIAIQNANVGFYATGEASGNTLSKNIACQSGVFDGLDEGVGNTWQDNKFCVAGF